MPVIKEKRKRFAPEEYTTDYLVISWPIQKYLDEKSLLSADVIRQLDMQGKDYMYRWVRAGETPVSFYKAMVALYGMPESFNESSLKVRPVSRHPLRIPGFRVEKTAKRYDEMYPSGLFTTRRLPVAPQLEQQEQARLQIVPKGQTPKRTVRNTTVTPPFSGTRVSNKEHAGMIAITRLCSVLKTERDSLLITHADFINQISEKDLKIQMLESELEAAKVMLEEALATPQVPALTSEQQELAEMSELTEAVRTVDSGLIAELDKLRPKSKGLAQ
jgi:hypothetical protein